MKLLLILVMTLTSILTASAGPYKLLLITDPIAKKFAQQFKALLLTKPPFSRMQAQDLLIEFAEMSVQEMNCGNNSKVAQRLIGCDDKSLLKVKAQHEAHMALAFTSVGTGGSGGNVPVASIQYSLETMLHEILHGYGFSDEYEYSDEETKYYCERPWRKMNNAYFNDTPPYANDGLARSKHLGDVPWMTAIKQKTLITQGTELGSKPPEAIIEGKQELGLYRGGSCNKLKKYKSWKPYPHSIMSGFKDKTFYPLYQTVIIRAIEASLGRAIVLNPSIKPPTSAECCGPKSLDTIGVTPNPELKNKAKEVTEVLKEIK